MDHKNHYTYAKNLLVVIWHKILLILSFNRKTFIQKNIVKGKKLI